MYVGKILRTLVVFAALAAAVLYPGYGVFSVNAAGRPAADFEVRNTSGGTTKLSDFKGRPVVVNFWASWCPPCRQELPAFDKLAEEYKGKVEFMMVDLTDGSRETVDVASRFVAEHGYKFPVYFDTNYSGASAYGIRSIPMTVVVDANGDISASHIGAMSEDTLRGYITALN